MPLGTLCLLSLLITLLADAQPPPPPAPANLVLNGAAAEAGPDGAPAHWSLHVRKGSAALSRVQDAQAQGGAAARLELRAPDSNYTLTVGQLQVPRQTADAVYVFTARARSEIPQGAKASGYFCAGPSDNLKTPGFPHNAGWQDVRAIVTVPAGKDFGRLDFQGGGGPAVFFIADVRVTPLSPEDAKAEATRERGESHAPQTAIPLKPGQPLTVRKIMPADCRLVRGFTHAPVDGRDDTRHAKGGIGEWSGIHGVPAVNYRLFNGNNGLHVTLAEEEFNALLVRGDWKGRLYANLDGLLSPGANVKPLCHVLPRSGSFRHSFATPVRASRLSFFYDEAEGKPLANVSFLRVSPGQPAPAGAAVYGLGPAATPDAWFQDAVKARFKGAQTVCQLQRLPGVEVALKQEEWLHLLTPPQDPALGVAAVAFSLNVAAVEPNALLTVRVHDPLDPRREVMAADFQMNGLGAYAFTLDIPDQVFLPAPDQWKAKPRLDGPLAPPPALWLSLSVSAPIRMENASVALHHIPREKALAEAGAWRKLLLRGLFSCMSEPRPWMHLKDGKPVREQLVNDENIQPYTASLAEVLETAELALLLLPDDNIVAQYHTWLYQNMDRRKPLPPPTLPSFAGAPRWAVAARQTVLALNAIGRWWVDNRLVPNGELGGGVNDDTDFYQCFQFLPMIESEPLGAVVKDAAQRLSDLAWREKLEEGINKQTMDALHAYEEGPNHLALCAWWFYGDPVHYERAMICARSCMKLLVETPDGRVHFGAGHFGIEQVRKGYDKLGLSPGQHNWAPARLMLHPMYAAAWYNRHPAIIERFSRWGKTWADYQKPDAFVEQVDIATGKPVKLLKAPLGPADEWLALYHLTGDPKWLAPTRLAMNREGKDNYWGFAPSYGRLPQALAGYDSDLQEKMRQRITSAESGYPAFFLQKNPALLNKWLDDAAYWFGRYPHMNTAAEQKTDRILTYNASAPISCYLGDAPNRNRWLNFTAVSYEGLRAEDFAALVWDAGPSVLRVAVYNFSEKPLSGQLRVWRLDHGQYRVTTGPDANDDGEIDTPASDASMTLQR